MNKAIFLDRDGTLTHEYGYAHKIENFRLLPNVVKALKLLKNKFKLFIVTNQSGIGRGYFTYDDLEKFNSHMLDELKKNDIKIEKTYVCPHSPEDNCSCRKPSERFVKEAKKEFNIDLGKSYVIGDKSFDIEMGHRAGCKNILVLTGYGKKHLNHLKTKPDFVAKDLLEAAEWILNSK